MKLGLREIPARAYAAQVLPLTHELWGYGRTLEARIAREGELASTAYGKRSFKTIALAHDEGEVLASFKRYERTARVGRRPLRAVGIGAVFTPPEQRGRGYASAMLGLALDVERKAGADLAYLFSDIHPQFYKDLGFAELPSRTISVRADSLEWARLRVDPIEPRDWSAIRTCFDAVAAQREWGFERPAFFWSWVRALLGGQHPGGARVNLVARRTRGIAAYVLGRREPAHDAYVVDEFGYADETARVQMPALLRAAAGDLRRIAGWLPPAPARAVLPRGSVRRRSDAVLMIAPLTPAGRAFADRAAAHASADPVWGTDHI